MRMQRPAFVPRKLIGARCMCMNTLLLLDVRKSLHLGLVEVISAEPSTHCSGGSIWILEIGTGIFKQSYFRSVRNSRRIRPTSRMLPSLVVKLPATQV